MNKKFLPESVTGLCIFPLFEIIERMVSWIFVGSLDETSAICRMDVESRLRISTSIRTSDSAKRVG